MVEKTMIEHDTEAKTPDTAGRVSEGGIRQLELDGFIADAGADRPQPAIRLDDMSQSPARMFVPSNRELVLEQLAAMVLSPHFPAASGTTSVTARLPFLVTDGLSTDEIDDLAAGQPQRFPVLVEVRAEAVQGASGVIGIRDVLGLRFRNQDEADDFHSLPFDELDTAFFRCEAEPGLFALDCPLRSANVEAAVLPDAQVRGEVADRIAGAICCLLELGSAEPACWNAISDLLCASPLAPEATGVELRAIVSSPDGRTVGVGGAVAQTFMAYEREAPGRLIEEVAHRVEQSSSDPTLGLVVSRWLDVARAVLGNRVELNGEILSDGGSIPLRAAILAAVVDDVGNLVPFLHAERPAGHRVIAAAALLLGLRTGLRNLSWSMKAPHLDLMSGLLVALHDECSGERGKAVKAFGLEPEETGSGEEFVLCWRDQVLARWPSGMASPDEASTVSSVPPGQATDAVVPTTDDPPAASPASSHSLLTGPNGRRIEVIQATDELAMITLRVALEEGEKLRKAKEIFEAACRPGICWRVGMAEDGSNALYMDLPGVPSGSIVLDAVKTLPNALSAYITQPKAAPKKKASTSKPRKEDAKSG
jgi:hypothetical protein